MMHEDPRQTLFACGCDLSFEIYLRVSSPRTGKIVSGKLADTLIDLLRTLHLLRCGVSHEQMLLDGAGRLLEKLVLYVEIAADFNQIKGEARRSLISHQQRTQQALYTCLKIEQATQKPAYNEGQLKAEPRLYLQRSV